MKAISCAKRDHTKNVSGLTYVNYQVIAVVVRVQKISTLHNNKIEVSIPGEFSNNNCPENPLQAFAFLQRIQFSFHIIGNALDENVSRGFELWISGI